MGIEPTSGDARRARMALVLPETRFRHFAPFDLSLVPNPNHWLAGGHFSYQPGSRLSKPLSANTALPPHSPGDQRAPMILRQSVWPTNTAVRISASAMAKFAVMGSPRK